MKNLSSMVRHILPNNYTKIVFWLLSFFFSKINPNWWTRVSALHGFGQSTASSPNPERSSEDKHLQEWRRLFNYHFWQSMRIFSFQLTIWTENNFLSQLSHTATLRQMSHKKPLSLTYYHIGENLALSILHEIHTRQEIILYILCNQYYAKNQLTLLDVRYVAVI
jgi:hypothetical protein